MKIAAVGTILWLLFLGAAAILPDETSLETIRVEDLKAELYFLASDELRGRAIQTPFNEITARYLARRFEGMGLEPGAGGSYFQEFTLVQQSVGKPLRAAVQTPTGEGMRALDLRDEFFPAPLSGQGRVKAPIVFAGFGVSAPDLGHDDYERLDVRGKIVLILEDEPGEFDPDSAFDGLVMTDHGLEFQKLWNAQQHGAVGVLIAPDAAQHPDLPLARAADRNWPDDESEARPQLQLQLDQIHIPAAYVSLEIAEELVAASGKKLAELQTFTEKLGRSQPVSLDAGAEFEINLERRPFAVRNVLARLPGSDPEQQSELIVIGAHFDHVGVEGDEIFNGADDNGSGTVGLLEVAEAYAASRQPPRRSVLFAAWNAEERGLLGSYFYVNRPVYPLSQTVAMFQMDMIGRDEEVPERKGYRFRGLETQTAEQNRNSVNVLGYSRSQDLRNTVSVANQSIGLSLQFRYDNHRIGLLRRSDNWPFLTQGVPALFFNTGLHPDYHRPSDTAEKINYEKMARIVRLVYLTSWQVANSSERPAIHPFRNGGSR